MKAISILKACAGFRSMWFVVVAIMLGTNALLANSESLYEERTYRSLAADNKAFRAGDVVTVQVFENSSASTNLDTTTRRKNSLSGGVGHPESKTGFDAAMNGEFDGGGRTQRTGRLLAQLTVSVREVLPNGELLLGGEQQLLLNNELQRISIEGRVRPQDISDGNVVLSSRLADARITYLGDGDLTERQRRAWWRKFVDWLGF